MAAVRSPAGRAPARHGGQDGYMLVEMVAALALTGLLLAFVMPMVPSGTGSARYTALVASAASLLRDTRSEAIARGAPVATSFDARTRRLRMGAREMAIPGDVAVSLTAGGNCPADKAGARIVFRADGTNCGGVLRFARGGRVTRVEIDWVDGRIDVLQGG